MTEDTPIRGPEERGGRVRWLKLAALVVFLLGALVAMQIFDVTHLFDELRHFIAKDAGIWGSVGFVVVYALLITLTMPGTVLTVLGATLFGIGEAFSLVIVGAMTGASLSFALGRFLGRDAVEALLGKTDNRVVRAMASASELLENRGVLAVAYLRMAYVPFVVLNYVAPLTGIRFRDFFIGTLLGILPGSFVFVFMGNTLGAVWDSGDWSGLLMWKTPVAIALFALSLVLPWAVQRMVSRSATTP